MQRAAQKAGRMRGRAEWRARAAAPLAAGRVEGLIERPRGEGWQIGKSGKRAVATGGRPVPQKATQTITALSRRLLI